MKIKVVALIIFTIAGMQAYSQENNADSTKNMPLKEPYHRNVIKINPTPMILFGDVRNLTFSYERLIKDRQSIAFQVGYLTFPDIFGDTIAGIISFTDDIKQQGLNLSFDYRYYPALRNIRPAPDGLFIGGYTSYFGFKLNNSFDILGTEIDESGEMDQRLHILNIGFDLGYQFVFWKRLTVDLIVFGPSLNYTYQKGEITGELDQEAIDAIDDELVDAIIEKFPILTQVFSEETLTFSGTRSGFDVGFRYAVSVGYHF